MANANPPKKAQSFTWGFALEDAANTGTLKVNPTINAGDFRASKDGGTFVNLTTTSVPAVTPAGDVNVECFLGGTQMNADRVVIVGKCSTTPKEWNDYYLCILTTP